MLWFFQRAANVQPQLSSPNFGWFAPMQNISTSESLRFFVYPPPTPTRQAKRLNQHEERENTQNQTNPQRKFVEHAPLDKTNSPLRTPHPSLANHHQPQQHRQHPLPESPLPLLPSRPPLHRPPKKPRPHH